MDKIIIISILFFASASCNSNRDKQFDKLLVQGAKLDSSFKFLQGKWAGNFQELNPTYDTVFYSNLNEKLEYALSDSITDSSLVKEIIIKDTFKLKPIRISFSPLDSSTWTSLTYIEFNHDSMAEIKSTLNTGINLSADFLHLQFGQSVDTIVNFNEYKIIELPDQYLSFQQALSSTYYRLIIKSISKDSLVLTLPNGYGNLYLKKNSNEPAL